MGEAELFEQKVLKDKEGVKGLNLMALMTSKKKMCQRDQGGFLGTVRK